jgi:hypothetical protein
VRRSGRPPFSRKPVPSPGPSPGAGLPLRLAGAPLNPQRVPLLPGCGRGAQLCCARRRPGTAAHTSLLYARHHCPRRDARNLPQSEKDCQAPAAMRGGPPAQPAHSARGRRAAGGFVVTRSRETPSRACGAVARRRPPAGQHHTGRGFICRQEAGSPPTAVTRTSRPHVSAPLRPHLIPVQARDGVSCSNGWGRGGKARSAVRSDASYACPVPGPQRGGPSQKARSSHVAHLGAPRATGVAALRGS